MFEQQRRATQPRQRLRDRLLEEPIGIVQASLLQPQLAQPRERLHYHGGADLLKVAGGEHQLGLRVGPFAAPDEHAGVLRPADGREHADPPTLAELLDPRAPLGRAVVIAYPLASEDLPAANHAHGVQLFYLTGGGRRRRLVQAPHAAGNVARTYQGQPFEGQAGELDPAVSQEPAEPGRANRALARARWIVAAEERDFAVPQQKPAILRGFLVTREKPPGPFQPPRCDCGVSSKREIVRHQPQRHPSRAAGVAEIPIETIGTLPGIEGHRGVVQPPGRQTEMLERLRGFSGRHARLEMRACLFPRARLEGVETSLQCGGSGWTRRIGHGSPDQRRLNITAPLAPVERRGGARRGSYGWNNSFAAVGPLAPRLPPMA